MPLPKPKPDEEHDEFMERCMADEVMQEDHPDEDERYAVCETQWEDGRAASAPSPAEVERRFTASSVGPVRIERADDKPKIVGLAAVYYDGTPATEYELWPGLRERIRRGAFSALLKAGTDTRSLFNHDPDNVLGRTTAGTLKLHSSIKGLEFEIDPPDTQMARDLVKLIDRGDVTGSSFSFEIGEEKWKHDGDDDTTDEIREITKVSQLFDVGPVTFPAYEATLADLRSVENRKQTHAAERAEAAEQCEAAEKQAEDDARFAHQQEMKARARDTAAEGI